MTSRSIIRLAAIASAALLAVVVMAVAAAPGAPPSLPNSAASSSGHDMRNLQHGLESILSGREIFRFESFGDEAFWSDKLRLHRATAGAVNGGVGRGLSPKKALAVGLKVDLAALAQKMRNDLRRGVADLEDPATMLALLKLDAVVGVCAFFEDSGQRLRSVGITCALSHSTVDDSLAPGIGRRLDGWAARNLNVGAIIALAPNLRPFVDLPGLIQPGINSATVQTVLRSWGPGKFDAALLLDGKAFRPDGNSAAMLIPPVFGLAGVNLHTWTGWGSATH